LLFKVEREEMDRHEEHSILRTL